MKNKKPTREEIFNLLEGKEFFSKEWGNRFLKVENGIIFDRDTKEIIGSTSAKYQNSKNYISSFELKVLLEEQNR